MTYAEMLALRDAGLKLAQAVQYQAQVSVSLQDINQSTLQRALDEMTAALTAVGGSLPDDFVERLAASTGATLVGCVRPVGGTGTVQQALDDVQTVVAAEVAAVLVDIQQIVDGAVFAYGGVHGTYYGATARSPRLQPPP